MSAQTFSWRAPSRARTRLALRRFSSALRLAARRQIIRWLRKLFDVLDDRLHAEEVCLRATISLTRGGRQHPPRTVHGSEDMLHQRNGRTTKGPESETFLQWEARKSGVSVKTKLNKKGRHLTAREFDLRFAR
jgi:hypothetical protein